MSVDISSRTIHFKLVKEEDAEFILSLRCDDELNKFLSKTSVSLQDQANWIKKYKLREEAKEEYYFIIYRNDNGKKIGTVRLYDFKYDNSSFCWGSWLLSKDKTRYAAIESAFLIYKVAFEYLGFSRSHFDVRKENVKVIDFHTKMGAKLVGESDLDYYFEVQKDDIERERDRLSRFLK